MCQRHARLACAGNAFDWEGSSVRHQRRVDADENARRLVEMR